MIGSAGAAAWAGLAVAAGVAVALCGLYCGMETGLYVLNRIRLDLRASAGSRPARRLAGLLRHGEMLLAVLLIGTNLTSYAATWAIATMFLLGGVGPHAAEIYTELTATLALFVLGDSVPKNIFRLRAERLMYRLSGLLRASSAVFTVTGLAPLVRGASAAVLWLARRGRQGPGLAQERVAEILAEGQAGGAMTHVQSVMADRVMRLRDVRLRNVMVPMGKVASVRGDASRDEMLRAAQNSSFSRLAVRDAAGQVVGVLDVYDVLADEAVQRPAERMSEPLVLPAEATVTDALYHMQRAHKRLAVVAGPGKDGARHVGIVTIKDLVEEIVGELEAW